MSQNLSAFVRQGIQSSPSWCDAMFEVQAYVMGSGEKFSIFRLSYSSDQYELQLPCVGNLDLGFGDR